MPRPYLCKKAIKFWREKKLIKLNKTRASLRRGLSSFVLITATALSSLHTPVHQAQAVRLHSLNEAPRATDWPQVQGNPQRTGLSPETLGTNFKVIWTHPFQPEKIYPQVQGIVSQGKVFIGTEMGNLYALNAATGAQAWKFAAGSPILASVAAVADKVMFGAMDGTVYAIDANTGAQAWKTQVSTRLGLSTSPVIADGKLMLGGRNGMFYAFDPANGNKLWEYRVGAPILQTAAANNGRVYFGAMNMSVYALNTANGTLAWKSQKVPQMAFKDYWPVVHQGKVIIRPMGFGELIGANPSDAAQTTALAAYDANPGQAGPRTMFVLDEATGQELPAVIHMIANTINGAPAPPCVDRDGNLIVAAPASTEAYKTGWGKLNLATRKIASLLEDGTAAGRGNQDENMAVTCSQNLVLAMHNQEYNAQFNGAFNLDANRWTLIEPGRTNNQLSSNTQGGGANPASIANGIVYHISWHELIARSTQ